MILFAAYTFYMECRRVFLHCTWRDTVWCVCVRKCARVSVAQACARNLFDGQIMVAGCDRLAACLTMPSFGQCILHMFHVVSKGNHPGLDFSRDFGWKKHFRSIQPSIAKHSQASQHPLSARRKLGRRQAKSRVLLQLPAAASDPFTEGFSIPNLSVLSSYRPTVLSSYCWKLNPRPCMASNLPQ